MTVEQARKLMPKTTKQMTDSEVDRLITNESSFCDALIEVFEKHLTSLKKPSKMEEGQYAEDRSFIPSG